MDFKKTLTVEVNQKGVSSTANALGKLAENASALDKPIVQAKQALNSLSKVSLEATVSSLRSVSGEVKTFQTNVKGLGELSSGMKGISGSFTSIATAAERLVSSTSGLDTFNAKLQAIRDTLQSMQGLSGTLTGVSKVPSGVTVKGSGGGGSIADPDKALATSQKRFLTNLERESMVLTQGKAAWLEYRAAQLGITQQSSAMIDKLKGTQTQLGNIGMSAKATAQAMRMVPAQFTDIVTQLAGGQSPFLIMIQQGGQMRDMFGGFGNMFKNVGGMILKFATSTAGAVTGVVGVVATLGYAFMKGRDEAEGFVKSLALTGNYAGMTRNSFLDMQSALAGSSGNASKAAEAMTALASTGRLTSEVIVAVTSSITKYSKATGTDIDKLAAQYASLAKDPVQGILKLNEGTNFLTVSTYEQIVALEKQGKTLEATKVAAMALAAGQEQAANAVVMNAGYMDKSYTYVKNTLSDIWDLMKSIGREKSPTMAAQDLESTLAFYKKKYDLGRLNASGIQKMNELEKASSEKSGVTSAGMGRSDFMAKQNAQRQIALQADVRLDQIAGSNLSKQEKVKKNLAELHSLWNALPDTSEKKNSSWLKDQEAKIRKAGEGTSGIKAADNTIASLKAELTALERNNQSLQDINGEYSKVSENAKKLLTVEELLASRKGNKDQINSLREQQKILTEIVGIENTNEALKTRNDQVKAQREITSGLQAESGALQDQIAYLKESGAVADTRTRAEKAMAKASLDVANQSLDIEARKAAIITYNTAQQVASEEKIAKAAMQTNSAKLQAGKMDLEHANTLATLGESQQKEIEWMALSNKEKEKAQALWAIEVASRKEVISLEAQKQAAAGNTNTLAILDQQIQKTKDNAAAQMSMVQAFQKTKESGLSFYGDLSVAAKNWYDSLPTQQQEISSVFSSTYSQISDVLTNFVTTGKANWKDFAKSVITSISQMLIKIAVLRMAQAAAGMASGGGDLGGGNQAGVGAGYGSINAKGNAFTDKGITAFARGGVLSNTVVTKPTYFAAGGVPGMNVMGERAGSVGEAAMPLVRNSKGDLSVNAVGQGGGGTQVNIEINIASDGSSTTSSSGSTEQDARTMADAISAAVQKELVKQQRNGGQLSRA